MSCKRIYRSHVHATDHQHRAGRREASSSAGRETRAGAQAARSTQTARSTGRTKGGQDGTRAGTGNVGSVPTKPRNVETQLYSSFRCGLYTCICHLFYLVSMIYRNGSMSISRTEHGRTNSKLTKTLGCRIPSEPMTISPPSEVGLESWLDLTPGRAALRLWAMVARGPSECSVELVCVEDPRGRKQTLAPRPGK